VTHQHIPLRDRLIALATHHEEPPFELSAAPTLISFAQLFVDSGLYSFDANKHLRTGALSPIYDCETESATKPGSEPERLVAIWAPAWADDDPVTGFRTGRDSSFLGSTPTVAMPQDERTAALLLLVTTAFVHLSAAYERDAGVLVQGAIETDDDEFRFLTLDPAMVPVPSPTVATAADDAGPPRA
jgi:hypothetical protein